MRKVNSITAIVVMILFMIHLVWGAMELFGMVKGGSALYSVLSRALICVILVHVILSLKLTFDTVRAMRRAGVSYFKENRLFWVRRISGIALMAFLIIHVILFMGHYVGDVYLLHIFNMMRLITQILLVASLFLHIITNIRPLVIAFGLEDRRNIRIDIVFVISLLLLFAGVAFVIYFIRWTVL